MAADDPIRRKRLKEGEAYFAEPYKFDFYQAVKLIEAWVRRQRQDFDETEPEPVGSSDDPAFDAVRFRANIGLDFRPSDIRDIDLNPRDGDIPLMEVDFMSLTGARGPLPFFYTELIRNRRRLGDTAMRDFFDIFNHRAISMLYRVRQRNRPTLQTGPVTDHPVARYLLSYCGLRGDALEAHLNVYDEDDDPNTPPARPISTRELIYYAGLLWHRSRSMHGLEQLLSHYYDFPVKGHELQGRWITLAQEARSALSTGRQHNRLGVSAVAGSRIWDPQSGFELHLGPLGWRDFVDFLPSGARFRSFSRLTKFYVRGAFDFSTRITVKADEIYPNRPPLSARGNDLRLGWTSWLLTKPMECELVEARTSGKLITSPAPVEVDAAAGGDETPTV